MPPAIAFVTYENQWFPCGGITAVMRHLPAAVRDASQSETIVLTPYHQHGKYGSLALTDAGVVSVTFGKTQRPVKVWRADAPVPWFFLEAGEGPSFFAGKRHPYDVAAERLRRDSLFFGTAVVAALAHLDAGADWRLVLQDWEAATAGLVFASQDRLNGSVYLTLHNSYDAFATEEELKRAAIDPDLCPGDTILQRSIAIAERPIFTVSEQFAADFTEDLLQQRVMAPHLQTDLRRRQLLGVDNGPFAARAVDSVLLDGAAKGHFAELAAWKAAEREHALAALDAHVADDDRPLWGNKALFRRDDTPWIVMAGRDDPRQKGFDVAALAVARYLEHHQNDPNVARFLFFPIPGDEGLAGLAFLRHLAERFPRDVLVFPFVWQSGFKAALRGAAYGLMPSLYEPFGMANEFYLAGGCVGIGRATGGNLEQIIPLSSAASFSRSVRVRSRHYFGPDAAATGFLFRERDDLPTATADWVNINDAGYAIGGTPDRVDQRSRFPLFREMAEELERTLNDAVAVYLKDPKRYFQMLAAGVTHIEQTFSWRRAATEYARYLK